jgi:hypothetical protein
VRLAAESRPGSPCIKHFLLSPLQLHVLNKSTAQLF